MCTSATTSPACSGSGGTTVSAAGSGSWRTVTRARTRFSAPRSPLLDAVAVAAGRADRPLEAGQILLRRRAGRCIPGGHDRVGALCVGAAGVLAQLQVSPAAGAALLLGQLRELHDDRRRGPERPRVQRACAPRRAGEGAERA